MNFTGLKKYLDTICDVCGVPGCDCVIYQEHRPIFRHQAGYADPDRTLPVTDQNCYCCTPTVSRTVCLGTFRKIRGGYERE